MKILLVGSGGFVGRELARRFSEQHEVLALNRRELDITNREAVRRLILHERPALVINCAVVGVDACESDPALARAVNVSGARNLAAASAEVEAEVVHLSSNYVFDGRRAKASFYTAASDPEPVNVYGKTKLAGERAVCEVSLRTFIVRTSWVFGKGKDNFFSTARERLISGKRLRAVTDVWANTTYLADFVIRLDEILMRRHYATYHVVNEGVCSYYEFALEVARELGMTGGEIERLIEATGEAEMKRLACRPRYTPMKCLVSASLGLAPVRHWREALREYLRSS